MAARSSCCCIIFSKDRPMQLWATLESLCKNIKGMNQRDIYIIIKCTNSQYKKGYRKVKFKFSKIVFYEEKNFRIDVLNIINNPFYTHVLFSVDDNIFQHEFNVNVPIRALFLQPKAIGFSLRLGTNINKCYMLGTDQKINNYTSVDETMMIWEWNSQYADFQYCLEVSSSIYRTSFMRELLSTIYFKTPNTMEYEMDQARSRFLKRYPLLLSFKQSKCFCNPINLTQTDFSNRNGGKPEYTVEKLLYIFLEKKQIIDLKPQYTTNIYSPHQILSLKWTPSKSKING